jgi:hypothetical protein
MQKKEITNSKVVELIRKEIKDSEIRLTKRIEDDTEFLARVTNSNFKKVNKKLDKVHKDLSAETSQASSKLEAEVERKDNLDLKIKEIKTRVEVLEKQAI